MHAAVYRITPTLKKNFILMKQFNFVANLLTWI